MTQEAFAPGGQTVAEIESEITSQDAVVRLKGSIATIGAAVKGTSAAARVAAEERVAGAHEFHIMRTGDPAAVYASADAAIRKIKADRELSEAGKAARIQAVTDEREKVLAQRESIAEEHGRRLLTNYPETPYARMTPELAPISTNLAAMAQHMHPTELLEQAMSTLRVAMDPAHTASARAEANAMLAHCYRHLLGRYAASGASHWRPFTDATKELHGAITEHLDTAHGRHAHRAAASKVEQLKGEYRYLRGSVERGGWDPTILMGTPLLYPDHTPAALQRRSAEARARGDTTAQADILRSLLPPS